MAKGRKTGGRQKGTKNNIATARGRDTTASQQFVARVERMLEKSDPTLAYGALERLACRFVTQAPPNIGLPVWQKLIEYKYGKPIQPTEISGKDGEPIKLELITNVKLDEN